MMRKAHNKLTLKVLIHLIHLWPQVGHHPLTYCAKLVELSWELGRLNVLAMTPNVKRSPRKAESHGASHNLLLASYIVKHFPTPYCLYISLIGLIGPAFLSDDVHWIPRPLHRLLLLVPTSHLGIGQHCNSKDAGHIKDLFSAQATRLWGFAFLCPYGPCEDVSPLGVEQFG